MNTSVPQTDEEIIAWLNARGNGDPDENGISLDQLRENRRRTPLERLRELEQCVASLNLLQRKIAQHRGNRA